MQTSYDTVADEYVRRIADELKAKPFDRALLDRVATRLAGQGPAWDLGCGPGHVTRYLFDRGVTITGLDLSPELVAWAQRLHPAISFRQGDFRHLPIADGAVAGIVALYSIIHLPREAVIPTLTEWRRVLRPGGLLLLAAHLGDGTHHIDDWWGRPVNLDFTFFQSGELERYLEQAGYCLEDSTERAPYPEVEVQTSHVYAVATTPAHAA